MKKEFDKAWAKCFTVTLKFRPLKKSTKELDKSETIRAKVCAEG